MKRIIVWGYGYEGTKLAKKLFHDPSCEFLGFADNSKYKQGYYSYGYPIRSINDLRKLCKEIDYSVIIASTAYREIIRQCEDNQISIEGIYMDERVHKYPLADFTRLNLSEDIKLYAGDIYDDVHYQEENLYGLSLERWDEKHINHDIRETYPLPDNSIYGYEAEEVFEYIDKEDLPNVLNEIYRILKPGGCCRISVADYNSPYVRRRSLMDSHGQIIFDAAGGGSYGLEGVIDGGQIYFPTYDSFSEILNASKFKKIDWLCYYTDDGVLIKKYIPMKNGYLNRVTNEQNESDYCIVVDCYK